MFNYASIILCVVEHAKMVVGAFVVGSTTTNVGMGAKVVRTLGTIVFGLTGHVAIASLTTIVIRATLASDYFFIVSPLCPRC
jgi:hypothetical protein